MTVKEIIDGANKVRANLVDDTSKMNWAYTIEKQIIEHMSKYSQTPKNIDSLNLSTELSLGVEYKDMYIYYIVSMIDLSNQDIAMYNNSCAFFNEMFLTWQKKWRRENMPEFSSKKEME